MSRKPIRHNPKESDIRAEVKEYLQWTGWFVFHLLQGLGSYPGLSDLVAVRNGEVVFVELKTPTGSLSEKQRRFKERIEAAGGTYIVARGVSDVEHLSGEKQMRIKEAGEK